MSRSIKKAKKPDAKSKAKTKSNPIFKSVVNPHPGLKKNKVTTIVKIENLNNMVKNKNSDIVLNSPSTMEQKAGIPSVISGDSFEGVKRIDHLPLPQQIDTVFNPLHSITKTTVTQAVSESTFIVQPPKK